jgi:hypothetical protein
MKKILFLAITLFSLSSQAQINIGIGSFGPSVANDTVLAGSSNTYDVWVKNYGPGTLNSTLDIYTGVWDSISSGIDSADFDSFGGITINPGDSTLFTLTADYTVSPLTNYRYGIDVIVIWPYAMGATIIDSLEFSVYILDPSGTEELDVTTLINIYPNPSADQISVNNNTGVSVELVAIYDMNGKLVLTCKGEKVINTEDLKPGMYQVNIILGNKKNHTFKIIKQKKASE